VFPDADDLPAGLAQSAVGVRVTAAVLLDLSSPEGGVGTRLGAMLGAPVPVATINEDDHPRKSKDNVRAAAKARQ
jgi:hypothetical protein